MSGHGACPGRRACRTRGMLLRATGAAATALLAVALSGCANQQAVQRRHDAAVYNTELGIAYMGRGELAVAQRKLDRALSEDPDSPDVHSARALLFARLGDPKQADREFREALRLAPNNPDYQNNYAIYLCNAGRIDSGVQTFVKAARNPLYMTPELAFENAGVCLRSAHRDAQAVPMFRQALAIRPNYAQAAWELADIAYAHGRLAQARREIETYLASNQETPDLLLLAVKVTRAQKDPLDSELYARKLQLDFPNSAQARSLAALGRNPG
jgi:type IV pilus assembly protein PilF